MAKAKHPLLIIVWKDHAARSDWQGKAKAAAEELAEITSVGWLVEENKEKIIIAASHDEAWEEFGDTMIIGKGLVVSKKVLRK